MINEKHYFFENNDKVFLETYAMRPIHRDLYGAMLVIPGGGYSGICDDREGEPIALSYMAQGFQCFVLHYSVMKEAKFPQPLIEASLAVKWIRDNAERFHIDPDRIFACGFSAGGHLCASLGTLWNTEEVIKGANIKPGENKIRAMVPVYAVLSANTDTHHGTFCNIAGNENPTKDELMKYSLDLCVNDDTVPAYIVHTAQDRTVPVNNSMLFAQALDRNHIPFELHIYQKGIHGMALANEMTADGHPELMNKAMSKWVKNSAEWLKAL